MGWIKGFEKVVWARTKMGLVRRSELAMIKGFGKVGWVGTEMGFVRRTELAMIQTRPNKRREGCWMRAHVRRNCRIKKRKNGSRFAYCRLRALKRPSVSLQKGAAAIREGRLNRGKVM